MDNSSTVSNSEINSDLLTVPEASKFLNLKLSRIRNLVFYKSIPFKKFGATIMFSKTDLAEWIKFHSYYPNS